MQAKPVTVRGFSFLLLPGDKADPETWALIDLASTERVSFAVAKERATKSAVWLLLCGRVLHACRRYRHPFNRLVSLHGVARVAQMLGCAESRVHRLRLYGTVLTLPELARVAHKIDVAELLRQTQQEADYPSIRSE